MGNPAVFELSKCIIDNQIVCIEDNIGESIHLHIGSIRIDLTVSEFEKMADILKNVLESLVNVEGFNVFKCDPFFLSRISREIPYLEKVYNKNVFLEDLFIRIKDSNGKIERYSLKDTYLYKHLKEPNRSISNFSEETYIFESYDDRIFVVKDLIERRKESIDIIIDKDGNILDGYISSCILLNNDVNKIKAKVFEFKENHIPIIYKERRKNKW